MRRRRCRRARLTVAVVTSLSSNTQLRYLPLAGPDLLARGAEMRPSYMRLVAVEVALRRLNRAGGTGFVIFGVRGF